MRTGTIALIGGAVLAGASGGLAHWPLATCLMLWPAFGGHWVEVGFLNGLRPRLPAARPVLAAARVAAWFVGGAVLALGMGLTAMALRARHPPHWPAGWVIVGGFAFIGVELVVHLVLQLRSRPSFYNGRG
jgi:hypothetical protein